MNLDIQNLKWQYFFWVSLLIAVAASGCRGLQVVGNQSNYYKMEEQTSSDQSIEEMIAPYKKGVDAEMNAVVGETTGDLLKAQPESTLGNFVADAILKVSDELYKGTVDLAISNYGGLRIVEIPEGPITKGRIFELMPFDNTLVVLEMNKAQLTQFYEHLSMSGGWPISAGVEIAIDTTNRKAEMFLNGQALEDNKMYAVCTSDYIANGGDQCSFLIDIPRTEINILFRDALLQYVKQTKIIEPVIENRCHF